MASLTPSTRVGQKTGHVYADTPELLLHVPADWLQKGKTGVRYSHHLYFWSALTNVHVTDYSLEKDTAGCNNSINCDSVNW